MMASSVAVLLHVSFTMGHVSRKFSVVLMFVSAVWSEFHCTSAHFVVSCIMQLVGG